MASRMYFSLQGDEQILSALASLRTGVRTILRNALTKASKPVVAAAQAGVHEDRTGQLRRSLGAVTRSYRNAIVVVMGPRRGFDTVVVSRFTGKAMRVDPAKYAHLVEFGTAAHWQPKLNWMHPGARPKPFLRPAWDAKQSEAERILVEQIDAGIEKEVARRVK